jgi:hypothetical protein
MQTTSIETPGEVAAASASRPVTFRLPRKGVDPYFGFSRSIYYLYEALGYWRLVRVRQRGKRRGIVLVPFAEIAQFVESQKKLDARAPGYVDETELKIRAQNLREKEKAAAK